MSDAPLPPMPSQGSVVPTACRGVLQFEATTPHTVYRGRRIYFCLPSCLQLFQDNPKTSCLAGDPLLQEGD